MLRIGFGGSCHWCTEGIFRSLRGVSTVEQGWIGSDGENESLSEAVIVHFDPRVISLKTLIAVHLHSHSCTSRHSRRSKYRSAIYTLDTEQAVAAKTIIQHLQHEFKEPIITQVLDLQTFQLNAAEYLDYYYSDPEKPFCKNYITPKLKSLMIRFASGLFTNS